MIPTLTGGGAERVILTLLHNLDRSIFKLSLVVLDMRNEVFLSSVPSDINVIDLKCSRVRFSLIKIFRLVWDHRPDVIFSTLGHLNLALAMLRPFLPHNTFFVARESSIVSEVIRRYRNTYFWRFAYRQFYCRFDKIICQSKYMAADLIENFTIPSTKVTVINNPIDQEKILGLASEAVVWPTLKGGLNLLSVGRLVEVKGFDLLIDAVALCGDLDVNLTILGDGPLLNELKERAQRLHILKKVCFYGFHINPYPYFARADVFILSSHYEGFPNVVLESLACGTPVIATPAVGGTLEILDGLKGCYIAKDISSEALAISIRRWVNSERTRMPVGCVDKFALAPIVAAYTKLFESDGNHPLEPKG